MDLTPYHLPTEPLGATKTFKTIKDSNTVAVFNNLGFPIGITAVEDSIDGTFKLFLNKDEMTTYIIEEEGDA